MAKRLVVAVKLHLKLLPTNANPTLVGMEEHVSEITISLMVTDVTARMTLGE